MSIWNSVTKNPPPVAESWKERNLFLGWAKNEEPAVFCSELIRGKAYYYIAHDTEGLSSYTPSHWLPLPPTPDEEET